MTDETSPGAPVATTAAPPPAALDPGAARLQRWEIVAVFAVSLGASGVYALVSYIGSLTAQQSLSKQTATLNGSLAPGRPLLDLFLQLTNITLSLAPVLLVLYLLAFHIGVELNVVAESLPDVWWRIPVLLLSAFQNAAVEEVVVVGYLLSRLERLGVRPSRAIAISAVIRGSYHLYQGAGGFIGNAVMGVIFGILYRRWGRVTPMIIAHFLIDAVAFVGYALLAGHVSWEPAP